MKILITGASGKLGTAATSALRQLHQLVLIARDTEFNVPNTVVHHTDLENTSALQSIFESEKPDIIIHLASVIGAACEDDQALARRVNVLATKKIAELAKQHGVKQFIFVSTAAVYHQEKLEATNEESNVTPRSAYGSTKLEAEGALKELADESSTKFIVFRVFNLYGPRFDGSLVNRLITSNADRLVQLNGYEKFFRDYIHVDDVIKVMTNFEKLSELDSFSIFNIASGRALSNAELVNELKQSGLEPHYDVIADQESYSWADISKAKARLDFQPASSLKLEI